MIDEQYKDHMNKNALKLHNQVLIVANDELDNENKKLKKEVKMLEKLIELNMNDLHEIADQRDWYFEEYQKIKDLSKVLKQSIHAALQREGFAVRERDEYKIGHDRYEKLRRLNLREMKELYLKHLHTLEHFDTLVDQL